MREDAESTSMLRERTPAYSSNSTSRGRVPLLLLVSLGKRHTDLLYAPKERAVCLQITPQITS